MLKTPPTTVLVYGYSNFGLIDQFEIVRETREGRMQEVEVRLSDWVFNALEHNEVLTLSRDYFRLRKPIERRIYELARKHCGRQSEWRISLRVLQKKCGAVSTPREFRRLVGKIIDEDREHSHIPDYSVEFESEDMVLFRSRGTVRQNSQHELFVDEIQLSFDVYSQAKAAAPGWDVYHLEREWRAWMTEPPRSPDAAFVGFCRKWQERNGAAR